MRIQHPKLHIWLNRMTKVFIYSGIELLLYFPIVLITYLIVSSVSILTWIVLMIVSYLLGAIIALTGIRRAVWLYITLIVASAMLVGLMTAGSIGWSTILVWGISCYLAYRGTQMIYSKWYYIFPEQAFLFGLICYFMMSVGSVFSSEWKPYSLTLLWAGIASLIVTFLVLNQHHLAAVAPKGFRTSASVLSKNRLWTFLLLGIIFFISFVYILNQVVSGFMQAMGWIVEVLFSWVSGLPIPEQPVQTIEIAPFAQHEEQQNTLWRTILNILFNVIAFSILLLIVGWLCYKFLPMIGPAIKKLIHLIKKWFSKENIVNTGYVDEKKQLMQWENIGSALGKSLKNRWNKWFQREPKWADLNNWRDRVRWLYKHRLLQAMSEGYVYRKDLSPRETIEVIDQQRNSNEQDAERTLSLANYYDKARYGGHLETISDEQVTRLKELTIKDKG
jgi:hypothetical protein